MSNFVVRNCIVWMPVMSLWDGSAMSPIFARATFGLGSVIKFRVEPASVNEKPKILRTSSSYFCILLLLSAQTAVAADRDAALECVNINSADDRLACFDAAHAVQPQIQPPATSETPAVTVAPVATDTSVVAPVAAAAAVSAPQAGVKTATEEEFGLPQPQSQQETLKSTITSVDKDPVGRLTFHLENGQAWKQVETKRFRLKEEDRPVAVIKHGSLGSFKLSVEGGSISTRVKRIK
jgi:hypothetical protein